MRYRVHAMLLMLVAFLMGAGNVFAQHDIAVHLKGMGDSTIVLGYYYAENRYVSDSLTLDAQGRGHFRGDSILPQGMYLILLPGQKFFDLLLGEDQTFSLEVDPSTNPITQKIKGSAVSEGFLDFQQFMQKKQEESLQVHHLDSVAKAKNGKSPADTKEYKEARALGKKLDAEVKAYQDNLIKVNGNNVLGNFCRSTIPVEIPEYTPPKDVKNVDSARWMWGYRYNTKHYLDNIALDDPAMLRSPITLPKIERFLDQMILQLPDTISKYCDAIIDRAAPNEETYRFFVGHFMNKYQLSEIVGMDGVFVHIAEKYYLAGKTPWVDTATMRKIGERVEALKPNLVGQIAPDFTVETIEGKQFQLSKSKAKATVLVFWEPSCSHCKVAVPRIDSAVRIYEPLGAHAIGFMTQGDGPLWQKYIQEHHLSSWTHVWDPYRKTGFHKNYDIYSTPVIYILDENKKIIVKRVGAEAVGPILEDMLKKK